MSMYKGGRTFAGLCSLLSVIIGLLVWLSVGIMCAGVFDSGIWSALVGFIAGLLATLPLRMFAELLNAIFDIAENSHKLVELATSSAKGKEPDK